MDGDGVCEALLEVAVVVPEDALPGLRSSAVHAVTISAGATMADISAAPARHPRLSLDIRMVAPSSSSQPSLKQAELPWVRLISDGCRPHARRSRTPTFTCRAGPPGRYTVAGRRPVAAVR